MGHLIAIEDGRPIASIVAYRKQGSGAFGESDLAFANRLVSHLARAFELYRMLAGVTHQRRALAEVMNRLPAGVVLLNDEGRVVLTQPQRDPHPRPGRRPLPGRRRPARTRTPGPKRTCSGSSPR